MYKNAPHGTGFKGMKGHGMAQVWHCVVGQNLYEERPGEAIRDHAAAVPVEVQECGRGRDCGMTTKNDVNVEGSLSSL